MMCVVLQMNLFDALPFADPQEALDAARGDTPDFLLTDIMLRGMSGIELAAIVQREMPSCKILLFSGQVDAARLVKQACEEGHIFAFLQKPIHPTELVAAIRSL